VLLLASGRLVKWHKIEYWRQASIASFKILYRDEHGVWDGIRWNGKTVAFVALGETDEKRAMKMLRGATPK
jgi:hypothetical protein